MFILSLRVIILIHKSSGERVQFHAGKIFNGHEFDNGKRQVGHEKRN